MSSLSSQAPAQEDGPAWEIARLFPDQGCWSEEDYLFLETNRLVEYTDGYVEVLPMPSVMHQRIVGFLCHALMAFVNARELGEVLFAPMPVRLRKRQYREPDVVYRSGKEKQAPDSRCLDRADLVMEVVSEANAQHDLVHKRAEYAAARIAEHWIVDTRTERITVLKLEGDAYTVHGDFGAGDKAVSALLPGFSVDVTAVWAAAKAG